MFDEVVTIDAVYENGVFRPLEPVSIPNHQRVGLTVTTGANDPLADLLEPIESFDDDDDGPVPTLEEVRARLAKIPGNWAQDIIAERDER